jgi:hypothetical protein
MGGCGIFCGGWGSGLVRGGDLITREGRRGRERKGKVVEEESGELLILMLVMNVQLQSWNS